jgi:hypothetical protein
VETHPGISPGTIRFADGRVLLLPREPLPQLAIATSESFLDCSYRQPRLFSGILRLLKMVAGVGVAPAKQSL